MIGAIVDELAPNLVARDSIGQTRATKLFLTAGDNPERSLGGQLCSPMWRSVPSRPRPGKTVRHRLNPDDIAPKRIAMFARHRLRIACARKGRAATSLRLQRPHANPDGAARQKATVTGLSLKLAPFRKEGLRQSKSRFLVNIAVLSCRSDQKDSSRGLWRTFHVQSPSRLGKAQLYLASRQSVELPIPAGTHLLRKSSQI